MQKISIIKKREKKFHRHHSDRYNRVKSNWRKPKGIDSCVRRKYKGKTLMPNIGYGSDKKTRNFGPKGFLPIRVNNINELKTLMISNERITAEISKNLGRLKKKKLMEIAAKMDIKISNPINEN